MSDFLSNFSGENYERTRQKKLDQKASEAKAVATTANSSEKAKQQPMGPVNSPENVRDTNNTDTAEHSEVAEEELIYTKKKKASSKKTAQNDSSSTVSAVSERNPEEMIETDPTFKNKQKKKYLLIGLSLIILSMVIFFTYYQLTHIMVPNFEAKELSEVREWTSENNIKLEVKQSYDFDKDVNSVIHQSVKNRKIKKGSQLTVTASLGPDPQELLSLPTFKEFSLEEAKQWVKEHKADNLAIIEEYSESINAGEFIKFEMTNKDVKSDNYKRKDKAKLYYSKGKEVFEKDISMPDFANKSKEEVNEWAKKNDIHLKVEESDSDSVENGKVISQSISKGTKVAKKETLTVVISAGKASIVPDFSQFTSEEAEGKAGGFPVQIKQSFSDTVPYGRFISQSLEVGKKFSEKDAKPTIQVVYSIGKPFIKDLRNNTLEGDLPKIFFDEYQSKGANITYEVHYVDSSVTKGTVVQMSSYNEFIPINSIIQIGVSRGNIQADEKKEEEPE
jgi:beta-lactam-binding protein with PASTA domain